MQTREIVPRLQHFCFTNSEWKSNQEGVWAHDGGSGDYDGKESQQNFFTT